VIPAPLPECRFRGREVAHERWFCASPQLVIAGRVVAESFCREQCRVADQGSGEYPDCVSYPLPLAPPQPRQAVPRLDQIAVGIVTAPREKPTLPTTLLELRRAGFSGQLEVFAEPDSNVAPHPGMVVHEHPRRLGLWANWLHAARAMLKLSHAPFVLLCEDDLWLTRDAALALSHAIDTLSHDSWGYASLYTPAHNVGPAVPILGWQAWDHPDANWGALAYCFPRHMLQRIVDQANPIPAQHTDQAVSELLRLWGKRCYFHVPSLCAHAGGMNSATGHRWHPDHRAVAFEHERVMYRAPSPPRVVTSNEKRLRVGFLTPLLSFGGAENWIRNLVQHLDDQRINVTSVGVLSSAGISIDVARAIMQKTTLVAHDELPQLPEIHRTASAWETMQCVADRSDAIIAWGLPQLDQWFSALRYSGRVIMVSQGSCEWTRQVVVSSSGRGHERVGVSQQAVNLFPPGPRTVIYNGSDEDRCQPTLSRSEVRRQWGVADDDIVIGYLGRMCLVPKNPLAAAMAVKALGKPYRAVYVGDGVEREEIQRRAKELDRRVVFDQPRDDVGNVLRGFDVFVLASSDEGLSLAMTETWLCGVPVVATAVGGVPELEDRFGHMVFRVPVDPSPKELAVAVQAALGPASTEVVQNARRVARKHLTARAIGKKWTSFLLSNPR
jgi:glycosyltransferase involved in cell wall biosynthesis